MSTPLEDAVLASFVSDLREKGLGAELVEHLGAAFAAERLPTAESIAELIKSNSGDKLA